MRKKIQKNPPLNVAQKTQSIEIWLIGYIALGVMAAYLTAKL